MMSTTFPQLWAAAAAGAVPAADAPPGRCELCGADGARTSWTPKPNWTAWSTHAYPGAGAICLGCAALLDGGPELAESGRWRRWTLFTLATDGVERRWLLRDRRSEIAALVDAAGWSVSIADGGKRHVAYLAPVDDPASAVMRCALDGEPVVCDRSVWRSLRTTVQAAYAQGASRATLAAGRLTHRDINRLGVAAGRVIDRELAPWRGTTELRLAAWLATREDTT